MARADAGRVWSAKVIGSATAVVDQVLTAGDDELVARHRSEWPELWARIDRLAEVLDDDRLPPGGL